jgi:hypothetical protein
MKATGVDQISCKLIKAGSPVLNKHLTTLLNTITHSQFPNRLKEAELISNLQGISVVCSDIHGPF